MTRRLYRVEVMSIATGLTVKRMGACESLRTTEKVERGANINLNHEKYQTEVVKCCWHCKENYDWGVQMQIDKGDPAEFCGESCVADFAAEEVKADDG